MPFYEKQPYIQPLHQVIREVVEGEILVPRFQRPGSEETWDQQQRGDLLDSLYRGFPVGTLLLWSSPEVLESYPMVGGLKVRRSRERAARVRYLLDGHQRVSTVVRILGPGLLGAEGQLAETDAGTALDEEWYFDLDPGRDPKRKSRDRFRAIRQGADPEGPTWLRLQLLFDRYGLNRWIREKETSLPLDLRVKVVREADDLRDRLRDYSMPVAVLLADSLDDATESFKRINSSGTKMGDYHMVAALTYGSCDLQEAVDEVRAAVLEPVGWGEVEPDDLLRICRALLDLGPTRREVDETAARLRQRKEILQLAAHGVEQAAKILRACGVLGPRILPYSWQLITLAIELARVDEWSPSVQKSLVDWFWVTTYGGVFAGVNSTIVEATRRTLRSSLAGEQDTGMERYIKRQVEPLLRFDFRAARSRAYALMLARLWDRGSLNGPAHRVLAEQGAAAIRTLDPSGSRQEGWRLAIIPELSDLNEARLLLQQWPAVEHRSGAELLERLGLPSGFLLGNPYEVRRDQLADLERRFVEGHGFKWRSVPPRTP